MANPTAYEVKACDIQTIWAHVNFTAGASGAVGVVSRSREFNLTTPVTHVSTGVYKFSLLETWIHLKNFIVNVVPVTWATTGVVLHDMSTNAVTSSPASVTVEFRTLAGALVDPASGDVVKLSLELQQDNKA